MPIKKSATSLEKLCLEIVHLNLNTLQHKAKYLPLDLIDTLYRKSMDHYIIEGGFSSPLPGDLFFNARTKAIFINTLDSFDWPAEKIIEKINRLCKNIQEIYLQFGDMNHVMSAITLNHQHILLMDLRHSSCTDHHLFVIGKQYPQLQHLDLYGCNLVTDHGIDHLPEKLVYLSIPRQITDNGQVNTLNRLLCLKTFDIHSTWNEIIIMLAELHENHFHNYTYQIENIDIDASEFAKYDILSTIGILFPKLHSVIVSDTIGSEAGIVMFLKSINCNLLTHLLLSCSANFIEIAAYFCPMLEQLSILVCFQKQTYDYRYGVMKLRHIPFKYLRELTVEDGNDKYLTSNDLKLLISNCHQLERLTIRSFNELSDDFIYNILESNPLKCVQNIHFNCCAPFSIECLCFLLKSLDSLRFINISYCPFFSLEDKVTLEKLKADNNWDLDLNCSVYHL